MRSLLALLLVELLLAPTLARAQDRASQAFAFPETTPGHHAQAWFAAYAGGEDSLRAFWLTHGSPPALVERPVELRLAFMRQVRRDQGGLWPLRVTQDADDFCEVIAQAEHGERVRIRFLCEPDPAHMLVGLRLERATDEPKGAAEETLRAPANFADLSAGGTTPSAPAQPVPAGVGDPARPSAAAPEATPGNVAAPGNIAPVNDALIVSALAARLDSLVLLSGFSGAVVLDKNGRALFARAKGMAFRTPRRLNTLETRFNLGSLNKIITHVAIEQLAQSGKLTLDDPVTRWLPDYKVADANRLTLRMLLEHRGGVPDMFASPEYDNSASHLRTMADWYALVRPMPLEFVPGSRQEYSNGGFVLLGMVIARASGEDYYAYVRRHIYEPAGMTRTGHVALDSLTDDVATGFTRDTAPHDDEEGAPPGLAPNTRTLPARGSSAGGGYSTAGDLVRFANALRARRLINAAHVRNIFGEHFALGIAGGSPGVNGLFVVAGPYTLVVLANLDPPIAEEFAPRIARMLREAAGVPEPTRP